MAVEICETRPFINYGLLFKNFTTSDFKREKLVHALKQVKESRLPQKNSPQYSARQVKLTFFPVVKETYICHNTSRT